MGCEDEYGNKSKKQKGTGEMCITRSSMIVLFTEHCKGRDRGSTVVMVLCYNSGGRWFDPSIDIKSFRSHYGPGVDSASNRNEYRERKVRKADNLTTILCRCHEIWEP